MNWYTEQGLHGGINVLLGKNCNMKTAANCTLRLS